MFLTVLAEDTSSGGPLKSEHGLSLFIEANGRRLLFDTGAGGVFAENAEKLDIRLSGVDFAVISHGHYDHGGGLKTFLDLNARAPVYYRNGAFEKHFGSRPGGAVRDIGLDAALLSDSRLTPTGSRYVPAPGFELFSDVGASYSVPSGNRTLFREESGALVPDVFAHEQNLLIDESGKIFLIAGCAHRGILNILDRAKALRGRYPDAVIGGFHLHNPTTKQREPDEVLDAVAAALTRTKAKFYTCHCTGPEPYARLKEQMGGQIGYLSTGDRLAL